MTQNDEWGYDDGEVANRKKRESLPGYPSLQWGNQRALITQDEDGNEVQNVYNGFHLQVGKDESLDGIFDTLGVPQGTIRFKSPPYNEEAHWLLPVIEVIPLTKKLVRIEELKESALYDMRRVYLARRDIANLPLEEQDAAIRQVLPRFDDDEFGISAGFEPRRDWNKAVIKNGKRERPPIAYGAKGWPGHVSFYQMPVLIRRIKGVEQLVTDVYTSPVLLSFDVSLTENISSALYRWRDEIIKQQFMGDPAIKEALVGALNGQREAYAKLKKIDVAEVKKAISVAHMGIPLGCTGIEPKGAGTNTSPMAVPGVMITKTTKITPDYVKGKVISAEERNVVETMLHEIAMWCRSNAFFRIAPSDLHLPINDEKHAEASVDAVTGVPEVITAPGDDAW